MRDAKALGEKQLVLEEVDEAFEDEVRILQRLIQIPTENPPGKYEEIISFLESYANGQGLRTEILETPPEFCRTQGVEDGRRLSIKTVAGREKLKPRILLLAHLDTVPAGDRSAWRHGPFSGKIADERIYGRGACDSKGRIATYIFAQLALSRALQEIPCEIAVASTADEEIGGRTGAKYLLENGKLDCEYCIGEGYTSEVFNGFKGLLWVRISIRGRSAHGATPQLGISAVEPLETLLKEVREYQTKLHPDTTLNIGIVKAGTKINMVPDSATVEIDMRLGSEYEVGTAVDDVTALVGKVQRLHSDAGIKLEIVNQSEPISIRPDHPLVRSVQSSVEEVTNSHIPVKLWFAHSDTLHFLKKGIPSVSYGVGRPGIAHTTDEYIYLNDLKIATKAVALSVLKLMAV